MKNKFLNIFFALIIIFSFATVSNAENRDMANRIFNGDFKSFFIGRIVEEDNKSFIIDIEKTFMGQELHSIQVKKFSEYTFSDLTPSKKDIIVAILKNDDTIDETWIFKATSTNYQTLFLANDKDPENEDFVLFQNYINLGTYIEDKNATSKKEEIKKDEKTNIQSLESKKATTSDFSEFDRKSKIIFSFLTNPVKVVGVGIVFVVIFYVLNSSKNFRRESEKDDYFDEYDNR